jgi:cellobiose-specific phosphotransferase system component IIC
MKTFLMTVLSSQAILFILGIIVFVILLYLRFFRDAATNLKDPKNKKPEIKS